jgi:hypothetical protein
MDGSVVISASSAPRSDEIGGDTKEFSSAIQECHMDMLQIGLSIEGLKREMCFHHPLYMVLSYSHVKLNGNN